MIMGKSSFTSGKCFAWRLAFSLCFS